ncbi:uncharacterized protein LOC130750920 isoform X2 [Actinidia eriantha]|uniref:uncharacterized protein LOC130750920 isoform X2 n=1 Tax=Actinidia eriantha TaxID=165200 RepID=UPI00258B8C46|nr:uncharacterized protein LOC130750920 isoform X2 [Actinidia eriantha]
MDPYLEQRLRDEVIHLHSLWRQGPPTHTQNHKLTPSTHLHHLSNPTQFKKPKPKPRGKKGNKNPPQSHPPPPSAVEWPCPDPLPPPALGWPVLKLPPTVAARLPSAEEQARFAAAQAQQKAVKAAQDYFADSDSDSDDEDLMEEDESEAYRFFLRVLTEDGELRSFYEKCWGGGDFFCLVCGGIGKKAGKRFKNCVALVQHANRIAKTKKRRAHRALAQVVCKVLGWDIDRLPAIVESLGKSVEQGNAEVGMENSNVQNQISGIAVSLGKSVDQGNTEVGMEDSNVQNQNLGMESVDNGEVMVKVVSNVGQEEVHIHEISDGVGDSVMFCESSLKDGTANECMENLATGNLSVADGKTGVVDSLEPCKDNGIGNEIKNDQNGILVNNLKDDDKSKKL